LNDLTVRERIEALLIESKEPLTAGEISLLLGLDLKDNEVYSHLTHIAKSIRRRSGGELILYMLPPQCPNCGYIFKNLTKPKKPSRCPRCKGERITPPRFIIDRP